MPGMTMPFKVRTATRWRAARPARSDRRDAGRRRSTPTSNIERTGHAPLTGRGRGRAIDAPRIWAKSPTWRFVDQPAARDGCREWRGRALAVTFIYTRCPLPDFCPLMDRHFADVQRARHGRRALRGRVHLLSVSFDPRHDTPAVLAAHAKVWRGSRRLELPHRRSTDEVESFASHFGVSIVARRPDPRRSCTTCGRRSIDRDGRLVKTINSAAEWQPPELVAS